MSFLFKIMIIVLILNINCSYASGDENRCPIRTDDDTSSSQQVSMISLIVNPEKYYGKMMYIKGLFDIDQRLLVIYLDRRSKLNIITKEAVLVRLGGIDLDLLKNLDGKFVYLNGIFEKTEFPKFIGEFKKVHILCLNYQAPKRMPPPELKKQ